MIEVLNDGPEFHLTTAGSSYIFTILPNGLPGSLHYGGKLSLGKSYRGLGAYAPSRYVPICEKNQFPWGFLSDVAKVSWNANPALASLSASRVRMEYSSAGRGDFRTPSFLVRLADGTCVTQFRYSSHTVNPGLPLLQDLPCLDTGSGRWADSRAETLSILFIDEAAGLELRLMWGVLPNRDAIIRWAEISNRGKSGVELLSLMSLSIDLPPNGYDLIFLQGSVNRERNFCRATLTPGRHVIGSSGGTSGSWWHNPFFALCDSLTSETSGRVWGFNLVYSGNFFSGAEVDPFGVVRAQMGISPDMFRWIVGPGETFTSPQAVCVYSPHGLSGLTHRMHDLTRGNLLAPAWRDRSMPVVYNSWEGNYFDIETEKIRKQARIAAQVGAEIFVIDDGWFGKRDNDLSSLGDWTPHPGKFPRGLTPISEELAGMGLGMGLWFEPEMVSEDSELFRAHPGYRIGTSRYSPLPSRNQYVLDFSNPAVVDLMFESMSKLISESRLSYIKWDMNRMMSDFYSTFLPADRQGELFHRYMLGVYRLYARLSEAFPTLLIESCASGGGRFDLGLLRWAPMAWASDNTDPISRIGIQYGTSFAYPLRTMSAHFSASPNHQVARVTRPGMRASVAIFASYGFELDLLAASRQELEALAGWTAFYKEVRDLVAHGNFFRLAAPSEPPSSQCAWLVVSPDGAEALCGIYFPLQLPDPPFRSIRLAGLDPRASYSLAFQYDSGKLKESTPPEAVSRVRSLLFARDRTTGGDELMEAGILIDDNLPWIREGLLSGSADFDYLLCRLQRIDNQSP